ncbi:unnamed protein product [Echinostoma caproni]|uniref:RTR1-type domain-containing protein n=1 Tax=Echinostoma caproni TaxID=27848 RepID=A0A183AHG7_9TREM|nr:unnamed protein product [Echinostoma caproni]
MFNCLSDSKYGIKTIFNLEQLLGFGIALLDQAASIAELGIEEWQFNQHAGEYANYCPVSLQELGEFADTVREPKHEFFITVGENNFTSERVSGEFNMSNKEENDRPTDNEPVNENDGAQDALNDQLPDTDFIRIPTTMRFAAEYHGRYYRMAGPEELAKFLADPTPYLPPLASNSLPKESELPERIPANSTLLSRDAFPTQIVLRGYCPVCFLEGHQRYEALKLGVREYLASYVNEVYTFCSNDCLLKFLRKPHLYKDLKLPTKLPPIPSAISVQTLPLPGFLEQTVSIALRQALSAVGQERPKYPFLKAKRSALIYMGLHLKAYNPRSPECEKGKYRQKLSDYADTCRLPKWLLRSMPLKYKSEKERSIDLTARLEQFLSLQEFVDTVPHWLAPVDDRTSKPPARGLRLLLDNPFGL